MQTNLPSGVQVEPAQLADMMVAAPAPKGLIQASQSANVGLKKPPNEMFQVEQSKSVQNRNKES